MNTKSDAKPINLIIVEEDARVVPPSEQARRVSLTDPFANILKNSTNLFN